MSKATVDAYNDGYMDGRAAGEARGRRLERRALRKFLFNPETSMEGLLDWLNERTKLAKRKEGR